MTQINDYEEAHDDERTNPYGTPSLGRIEARLVANQLCDAGCDGGPNGQIDGAGVQPAKDGKLHFKTITPLVIDAALATAMHPRAYVGAVE